MSTVVSAANPAPGDGPPQKGTVRINLPKQPGTPTVKLPTVAPSPAGTLPSGQAARVVATAKPAPVAPPVPIAQLGFSMAPGPISAALGAGPLDKVLAIAACVAVAAGLTAMIYGAFFLKDALEH